MVAKHVVVYHLPEKTDYCDHLTSKHQECPRSMHVRARVVAQDPIIALPLTNALLYCVRLLLFGLVGSRTTAFKHAPQKMLESARLSFGT